MPYLRVYFNGALKAVVELKSGTTTIGRHPDNDVKIDNAGVSGHHAKIFQQDDQFVIEDVGSRNGVFVNGERITRRALSFGDEVTIVKNTLRFSAAGFLTDDQSALSVDTNALPQDRTVAVGVAQLGAFLKERKANSAYLLLEGASARSSKYPLSKNGFCIGNSKTADLSIGGWFAPRIAAKIMLQSDGFYISPEMRGRVRLNGVSVSKLTKLHDGDNLTIRGTALKFVNRPSSG